MVRSDFYINLVIGRAYSFFFQPLIFFYFFFLRQGVSRFLNGGFYKNMFRGLALRTHFRGTTTAPVLRIAALAIALLAALPIFI